MLAVCTAIAACDDHVLPAAPDVHALSDIAELGLGWQGEIVGLVDQSYAGWDVEIGDLDGDGVDDIVTGTAPNSRIDAYRREHGGWTSATLVEGLAISDPGIVLDVRLADVDGDHRPDLVAGTGEEDGSVAVLAMFELDAGYVTRWSATQSNENTSSYTHGIAAADLDQDGKDEIVSAYCGHGEVIRYDFGGSEIDSHKILQLPGSGEDAQLADVDGDGWPELVVVSGFREGRARVEIHDVDPATGLPALAARVTLDQFDDKFMFEAAAFVGDLDGDGRPEVIVGWKHTQHDNRASLVAYHVDGSHADIAYVLARDDTGFDLGYFEKMMAIADVDGDGRRELLVSTRGDGSSEGIWSTHLGQVFAFRLGDDGSVHRDLVADFDPAYVDSSWLAIGDVDGDGHPDVVLATGHGDRRDPGWSWVIRLWHP